jgi:hypothetical protein
VQTLMQQVRRSVSSSSPTLQIREEKEGDGKRQPRSSRQDAYAPWTREVYGNPTKSRDRWVADTRQEAPPHSGSRRPRRQVDWQPPQASEAQQQQQQPATGWQERPRSREVQGGGFQTNVMDAETSLDGTAGWVRCPSLVGPISLPVKTTCGNGLTRLGVAEGESGDVLLHLPLLLPLQGARHACPSPFLLPCSQVRMAPRLKQRHSRMYPAYLCNTGQSLLRSDVAAFFDGYGLDTDEIRWVCGGRWGACGYERAGATSEAMLHEAGGSSVATPCLQPPHRAAAPTHTPCLQAGVLLATLPCRALLAQLCVGGGPRAGHEPPPAGVPGEPGGRPQRVQRHQGQCSMVGLPVGLPVLPASSSTAGKRAAKRLVPHGCLRALLRLCGGPPLNLAPVHGNG